ncbi:PIN domain protein [Acetatifactor muris]|uniref:PIN domain protein n=2 Tax=Acetatifactor muris TaxID=879566 RepID=A0A2K4ZB52_9FIRM|nr:PIN domain protein [Acetatifactor muris]
MMKVLLDTHIILWVLENNVKLPEKAREIIEDERNQIYYSTASVWEIAIKHMARPDKMRIDGQSFSKKCMDSGFEMLPVYDRHVYGVETLSRSDDAPPHNDPFDRIMLSQAKVDKLRFITHDSLIPFYNEECILAV